MTVTRDTLRGNTLKVMSPEDVLSERTCFIVGAGASFDCLGKDNFKCVPLTRDLVGGPLVSIPMELERNLVSLMQIAGHPCEPIKNAVGKNLEVTVDLIRGLCDHETDEVRATAVGCLRDLTRLVAQAVSIGQRSSSIAAIGKDGVWCFEARNYYWLAATCCYSPASSIISLNYDCLLDWSFQVADQIEGFPKSTQFKSWLAMVRSLTSQETVRNCVQGSYVKLHGSLYLYSCHNPRCRLYRVPVTRKDEWKEGAPTYFALAITTVPCRECGEPTVDLVLPPGRNKTKAEDDWLARGYRIAGHCLEECDTWIFIGYSCPEYDEDVLALFRDAASKCPRDRDYRLIMIVAPDASEIRQRVEQLIVRPALEHGDVETTVGALPVGFSDFVALSMYARDSA